MKHLSAFVVCVSLATTAAAFPPFESSPLSGGPTQKATGFFRAAEIDGRSWIVDPRGQPTLSIGTDHVRYDGHGCESLGYAPYGRNAQRRYGTADRWAEEATRRLRAWNFNVLGAGNSAEARHRGLAHTEFLSFGADFSSTAALVPKTFWTGWPDIFDPRFETFCEARAKERCRPARDDPWLLGYFLDNELEWFGKNYQPWGIATDTFALPATAAGKKALAASLRQSFDDKPAEFSAAFDTQIKSFDELPALKKPPHPKTPRAREALAAFVAEAAGRYFRITTAVVRRHDPNHLILGCRFAHDAPEAAWREAGATCDIVSVNVYPRIDLWHTKTIGLEKHLRDHFELCHKPMLLTEWGFPALDAKDSEGRPLPSVHGAGMRVDNQQQKAACYAIFQRNLLSLPFMVGSHYFMWCDEPSRGISKSFPEDSNYGLVTENDEPYTLLTAAATRVNAQLPALHAGKIGREDISPGIDLPALSAAPPVEGKIEFAHGSGGYRVDMGRLRLVKDRPGGKLFDRISWRANLKDAWTELGCYEAVVEIETPGGKDWSHAEKVDNVRVVRQDRQQLVLEIECSASAPRPWRACYRLEFRAGWPAFRARCLWVENSGTSDWTLAGYFHYLPSSIGGDARDGQPRPVTPDYWVAVGSWRDPALRLHYGAMPPQGDDRFTCYFWKDEGGGQHPDCRRKLGQELKPGGRWAAPANEPDVLVFGLRENNCGPAWAEVMGMLGDDTGGKGHSPGKPR